MNTSRLSFLLCLAIAGTLTPPAQAADDSTPSTNSLIIHADKPGAQINRNIYGQFSEHLGHCIYGGVWVGADSPIPNTRGIRNDVVQALRKIKVPVLRWPGGCFADEYHWKDGIGPLDQRPAMINTSWGGVVENNHFGTHEFMDFCEQIGTTPYVCVNLGSGTVQEMMEWVEYMTSDSQSPMANLRRKNGHDGAWKVPFIAEGNESWGCGGNMSADFYADNYIRYNTFLKNYPGNKVYRIATGLDYAWNETMLKKAGRYMDGISLHHYSLPRGSWSGPKGSATDFPESEWLSTLRQALEMEELVTKHSALMDRYDPTNRIGLIVDEWGAWYDVEPGTNPGFLYQQNTLRDALVAGATLNILNNHADRVKMANIAQLANVLQAMVLTDNAKMIVTPTYHIFEMYMVHQDATLLPSKMESAVYQLGAEKIPGMNASASRDSAGKIHVTLCNLNPRQAASVSCELDGAKAQKISGRILTAPEMNARNTFENPEALKPAAFSDFKTTGTGFSAVLPAKSVVLLELE